jgi:hypothetical protein
VNIETCLVAVMMRGLSAGFTGSCAAGKIAVVIKTDNKHAKKRTRILSSLLVLVIQMILIKKRRSRTDVCILFLGRNLYQKANSSESRFGNG